MYQFFHNFCTETLIPQRFSQDVPISKDNVLQITKTREHSRISCSILSKHLENRFPVRPYTQALKAKVSSIWHPAMLHSQIEILDQNFSCKGTAPTSQSLLFRGKKAYQPMKTLTKNPHWQTKSQCVCRDHVWSAVSWYSWFSRKPKSSLSSFFSGFTMNLF